MQDELGKVTKIWFTFQKTRYVWSFAESVFKGLTFPVGKTFREYADWRGYQEEQEIRQAENLYGQNQ